MIVGTAGHIDHGKTALVRALTGVDTDRLKEEKERGITIALGYAYHPLPDGNVLGFIDVPGHERLVHTMLAGAAGIDFCLLVVAADDGVMPQTREHLQIIDLLGISTGAVALTKIDRVDAARIDAVRLDIQGLLAATPLVGAPIFPLSALTGEGINALLGHLHDAALSLPRRESEGHFRLAVDRSFTLRGIGTVVTGTVFAGSVSVGADLMVAPSGKRVRLRGLHAQDRPAESGHAGQRCALSLAGVDRDEVARGDWIVAPPLCIPVERFDGRLTLSPHAPAALRQWSPVHLHLGAAHEMAHLVLLQGERLAPGESGLAQVVPERPIGALHGDRFIIRDVEARHTLGGGRVLDIDAPMRKRRTPERLAELSAMECNGSAERLRRLLDQAQWGLDLTRLMATWNCPGLTAALPADARRIGADKAAYAVARPVWADLQRRLLEGLAEYHRRLSEELGPDAGRARRMWLPRLPLPIFQSLVDESIAAAKLRRTGAWLHRPEHDLRLSAEEDATAQRILMVLRESLLDPPWARDLATALQIDAGPLRKLMRKMSGRGALYQVVPDLFFVPEAMDRFTEIARQITAEEGGIRAATFRDRTGLGRKRSIQILEYFDRVGFTRRVGDLHRPRADGPLAALADGTDRVRGKGVGA